MIVKLKCEPFLIQFFQAYFETSTPIEFPTRHDFNNQLDFLLTKPPKDWEPEDYGENTMAIKAPYFENKNVLFNWHLSDRAQAVFVSRLTCFFKIVFNSEMNQSLVLGFNKKESIQIFQEKYRLGQDTNDMLEKSYSRYIKTKIARKWRLSQKNLVSIALVLSGVWYVVIPDAFDVLCDIADLIV